MFVEILCYHKPNSIGAGYFLPEANRLKVTTQNLGGIFTTEARRTQRRK